MSYYQHEDINNAIVGLFAEAKNNDNKTGTVLDVGCGRGRLGLEIETLGFRVTGIDDNSVACETARTRLSEVIELNLMDFAKVAQILGERRFDWLMMADVLEHLPYPEKALEFYKQYLAPGGRLMLSLPNAVVWDNRLRIMLGRFDYRDSGTMDRTHLRFFTFRSARELVENAGFTPLRRTLEPGIVRAFLPLVKKLVAGKDSPSGILESPSYQFYKHYLLPVEQALASILPGLFAFRTVMTAKLTRPGPRGRNRSAAPEHHHGSVKIEGKVHLVDACFGHDRAQPPPIVGVKQQESTATCPNQLAAGHAGLRSRKLIQFVNAIAAHTL